MGQLNNFKAGIRFENNNLPSTSPAFSSVENCVIHENAGWGLSVVNSSNVSLKNIDVFDVEQIGVSLDGTTNVSADSVNVYGVRRRAIIFKDNAADRECCFAMCSFTDGARCTKTSVTNSIVAGCPYAGFIALGYSCADPVGASTSNVFKDNIAHSVDGSGFCIFPDPGLPQSGKVCY